MIERGVKTGMYELESLRNGEEELGGNHFYTMSYETKDRGVIQSAKLYLYFPDEQSVAHFLVAHYSESAADKKNISTAYQESFLSSLASVSNVLTEFEKFYYMTDGTNITPCESIKDPSLVLAKLEDEGMVCAESPGCPTCGCFEFFAAQICSCQNSVEWTISFFDDKEHCKRARK